jgi:hypothetical protein
MTVDEVKTIARDPAFTSKLDDTRREWLAGQWGCGCNAVKIMNFVLRVCRVEFDAYCRERNLS